MGQQEYRLDKLQALKELGIKAFPERYETTHLLKEAGELPDETTGVKVAGRVVSVRKMGKLTFAHLQDIEGRVQVSLKKDAIGENYDIFHKVVDIGDFIGVAGHTFTTKTGEKTVMAEEWTFLGKSLRELPEKWHGLKDVELIYRQRYLDLISSPESRRVFLMRSKLLRVIRNFLEGQGFLEVETQILTNKASGALASPFITHYNALDINVYLRIAPETYLKRLVVGGFTHVFEVARCFRNEGISPSHLQDFTMIEGYSAYFNYQDNMKLLREMIIHVIKELFGTTLVKIGEQEIDFAGEWPVVTFRDLLLRDAGIDIDLHESAGELFKAICEKEIKIEHEDVKKLGKGNLIDLLYKKVSRPKLICPTFLTAHPIELSPLARQNDDNPNITDRFQLIVNGAEIINAYSELVDPIEQRSRLENQSKLKMQGDAEAMPMDNDYLKAMEYGMPPISGWGMGVDRLMQVLLDLDNIRDSVLFPTMRPLEE
ncbi:MAG: lysyl-tRNA synthetase class II [Bacillota bacterium]|nr:MAG: lysyl-tRNA synthetase class II [Bacillota bacterium]